MDLTERDVDLMDKILDFVFKYKTHSFNEEIVKKELGINWDEYQFLIDKIVEFNDSEEKICQAIDKGESYQSIEHTFATKKFKENGGFKFYYSKLKTDSLFGDSDDENSLNVILNELNKKSQMVVSILKKTNLPDEKSDYYQSKLEVDGYVKLLEVSRGRKWTTITNLGKTFLYEGGYSNRINSKKDSNQVTNIYNVINADTLGPISFSIRNAYDQKTINIVDKVDYIKLSEELSEMIELTKKQAQSAEHFHSISELMRAQEAVKGQNESKASKHLKSAGKWVSDLANATASNIIANLIQNRL